MKGVAIVQGEVRMLVEVVHLISSVFRAETVGIEAKE